MAAMSTLWLAIVCLGTHRFTAEAFTRSQTRVILVGRLHGATHPGDFDAIVDRAAAVAEAAARAAGKEIVAGMGAAVKKQKLNFKDIVTGSRLILKCL
jgi:hypothetical protein